VTAHEFCLPDLGEGLTEAEVVRWLVEVGDTVDLDQPVVEVETAKAAVEVPSPFAGIVTSRHGAIGDVLAVGSVLLCVSDSESPAGEQSEDGSGSVLIGYGVKSSDDRPRRRRVLRSPAEQSADPEVPRSVESDGAVRVPLTGIRRAAAELVSRSRREIPEATVWVDVDATALMQFRQTIREAHPDVHVTLLGLVARMAVLGLTRFPELNSRVDTERNEVVLLKDINVGFAAQTERGLVVPVVRRAQALSFVELSRELIRLTELARSGGLGTSDVTGGTFTVNNYGVFGVDGSAAIINYPEAAILGIGRVVDRPWAVNDSIAVRQVTQFTLAFDHRVCDGAAAGGFLRFVADLVENPDDSIANS
jgi:2-oxoisovalerate dehydrogenase E2 component (dihydrolipoyl transacylase)